MKALNSLFSVLLASLVAIYAIACSGNAQNPSKINVDEDIIVAIYPTIDNGDTVEAISPCLLEDTVHVSELIHYPGDDGITIPFNLSDTTKYAEITERNIEKRIAISINGRVVSTPVVKMKIANGACSVILPRVKRDYLKICHYLLLAANQRIIQF